MIKQILRQQIQTICLQTLHIQQSYIDRFITKFICSLYNDFQIIVLAQNSQEQIFQFDYTIKSNQLFETIIMEQTTSQQQSSNNQNQKYIEAASEHQYVRKQHTISKKFKINTSRSRGQLKLIKTICKDKGWTQVFKGGDVMWSGLAIPEQDILEATQIRVNRIPAMPHLCHKKTMGFILNKFRQYWPENFWFYPRTYLLPQQTEQLQAKLRNSGGVYIAKPSAGCQGDGISLIKKLSEIPKSGSQWVVQPYIDKPLLINKRKFDFRLYVLISSIDPYICYLNEEGLARFCTEDYETPTKQNLKNPYIHLTNYSLNKNHPQFINPTSKFQMGSKTCLKPVWEELAKQNVDISLLRERIQELTKKFLTGIYPFLKYYYHATFPKGNGKCFHVLGIDILVDQKLNPWLLQANNNPSFNIEHETTQGLQTIKQLSPVDEYVKRLVMEDTIYLVNRSIDKQKQLQVGHNYFSFKKILDGQSEDIQQMNIIENMLKIFHSQCSIRSKWILTSSQFSKLANLTGMVSEKITKNDYHIIFIKIMRFKPNANQMTFQDFIEAMEYLIKEIVGYTKQNKLQVMQNHIEMLVGQLH